MSKSVAESHRIPGSRIGERGGIFNSTPPKRANRRRIASPRSVGAGSRWLRALFKSSRASCSMDRPLRAARIRSLRLVISGNWRIVMLAMIAMIALQSMIAHIISGFGRLRRVLLRERLGGSPTRRATPQKNPQAHGSDNSSNCFPLRQPLFTSRIQLSGRTAASSPSASLSGEGLRGKIAAVASALETALSPSLPFACGRRCQQRLYDTLSRFR